MPRKTLEPAHASSKGEQSRTPLSRKVADGSKPAKEESEVFGDVIRLIAASRARALRAGNTALIEVPEEQMPAARQCEFAASEQHSDRGDQNHGIRRRKVEVGKSKLYQNEYRERGKIYHRDGGPSEIPFGKRI